MSYAPNSPYPPAGTGGYPPPAGPLGYPPPVSGQQPIGFQPGFIGGPDQQVPFRPEATLRLCYFTHCVLLPQGGYPGYPPGQQPITHGSYAPPGYNPNPPPAVFGGGMNGPSGHAPPIFNQPQAIGAASGGGEGMACHIRVYIYHTVDIIEMKCDPYGLKLYHHNLYNLCLIMYLQCYHGIERFGD